MKKSHLKQTILGIFLGFLIIFIFFILLYAIGILYLQSHEQIHKQIYQRYQINSIIQYDSLFLSAKTKINFEDLIKCNDYCKLANALNDIIGYNIRILIFHSWALFFMGFIVFYFFFRKKEAKCL